MFETFRVRKFKIEGLISDRKSGSFIIILGLKHELFQCVRI
jgi:hypothetical protein